MSLDSALRSRLVAGGDAIVVNVEQGLREVHGAVARRRRRVAVGTVTVVALVLAATDTGVPELRRPGPPPAREVDERLDPPVLRRHDGGVPVEAARPDAKNETLTVGAAGEVGARPGDASGAPVRRQQPDGGPGRETGGSFQPLPVRRFVESYEKTKVGVITTGENGGLGCSDGEGRLGGNDCFMFEVFHDETRLEIRLLDDGGVSVGARVYQYTPGSEDSDDLGMLCGGTVSPLVVTPGSTIAVYIQSTNDCSGPITTGEMTVRLWAE